MPITLLLLGILGILVLVYEVFLSPGKAPAPALKTSERYASDRKLRIENRGELVEHRLRRIEKKVGIEDEYR